MLDIRRVLWAPVALLAVSVAAAQAQTIDVPLDPIPTSVSLGPGGGAPFVVDDSATPSGKRIDNFQPASYVEYTVNVTTPGLYTVSIDWEIPGGDPDVAFAIETRPVSTDPYVTRYTTPDATYPKNGDTWQGLQVLNGADGQPLTVPLQAGDNVLRVQNVARRHAPATSDPNYNYDSPDLLAQSTTRPDYGAGWSDLRVGQIQLNRVEGTAGDLPTYGTVKGTVTGNMPAGSTPSSVPVRQALVTANPPGQSQLELSNFWKNGYWTYSKTDGSFSLQAPVGSQEIMAGRPSSYRLPGSPKVNVTVATGTPATANLTLTSIFFNDASNGNILTAYVQNEYFDSNSGTMALLPGDMSPQNRFKLGWTDPGDTASMIVDVPKSGWYEVTSAYDNGGDTGSSFVRSDIGSSVSITQPNHGWQTPSKEKAASLLYLTQGPQTITQGLNSGASDMDGIELRLQADVPVTVGVVNGTVMDTVSGKPVSGVTVRSGNTSVTTNAQGFYSLVLPQGRQTIGAFTTYQDTGSPQTITVDVPVGGTLSGQNFLITLRPHFDLSTAAGYTWKVLPNTGSAADYSAVTVDESGFQAIPVPGDWSNFKYTVDGTEYTNNADGIYGWYRLHFTVPDGLLTTLSGTRNVTFRCPIIDDIDATYLNGQLIGTTGRFPSAAAGPVVPGTTYPAGTTPYDADEFDAWGTLRLYTFPASLLVPGDNVLAIKVYDNTSGGGLRETPSLETGIASGTVSGTVTAGGSPVAGVRVTAEDMGGIATDWTLTGADGKFTLINAPAGDVVLGVAKPGYGAQAVYVGKLPQGESITGVSVALTADSSGPAPSYAEFSSNDSGSNPDAWKAKWDALSELSPTDMLTPTVTEPGFDVNSFLPIPGTITVQGGSTSRGGILSKARFDKYASVSSACLVSAPLATDTHSANAILQLNGNPIDDLSQMNYTQWVEEDAEGLALVNGANRVRARLFAHNAGELGTGPVPIPLAALSDTSPTNPLDFEIVRTGNFYDFYFNGTRIHSAILPTTVFFAPHRIFLYSFATADALTWDWVKAGPAPATPTLPFTMARQALQIAAGIDSLATADKAALNVVTTGASQNVIDVSDAIVLAQQGK